jgi:glycosyltransferase involved in cell wall biosynthesis
MIVKDESAVIRRCLSSLRHIIDHWIIVDTGSTDGTQDIIREFLSDIPGEIFERPWKNFGHNRSEALQLAKGKADYLFIIDADEVVKLDPGFSWENLYHDSYLVQFLDNGISYVRCQLVNNHLEWSYKGVLHEYIESREATNQAVCPGIKIIRLLDGARSSDPQKFKKDALILEQALLEEPDNDRYLFYLAQSYRDCGDVEQSLRYYKKRVAKGGWDQEVWYSLYQIAQLMERAGEPWPLVMEAYLKAYGYRPNRVGPLYRILRHYMNDNNQFHLAYIFGKTAIELPIPQEALFVEQSIYDFYLPLDFGICAYYLGKDEEAIEVNNRILTQEGLTGDMFLRALENRRFSLDRKYPAREVPLNLERKINVIVHLRDPGHFLDNCVERLMQQQYASLKLIFVDGGSSDDSRVKVPVEKDRVEYIRLDADVPLAAWIAGSLSDYCDEDDLVFFIDGDDWLESDDTLSFINRYFNERDCEFLMGQFRFSDGRYGKSMPLAGKKDLAAEPFYPIAFAFTGGSFRQLTAGGSDISIFKDAETGWLTGNLALDALARALVRQLDASKAQFTDQVMVVYNIERFSDLIYPGTEEWLRQPAAAAALATKPNDAL